MSDFDVVRVWLDNVDASHFRGTDNDPYAALDRIEAAYAAALNREWDALGKALLERDQEHIVRQGIEAENALLRGLHKDCYKNVDFLRAENARLREALEAIVPTTPPRADNPQEAMARAALSSEESA